MKSSSCIAGCLDVENPIALGVMDGRLNKLHRWAVEDKEFLMNRIESTKSSNSSKHNQALQKSLSSDPLMLLPTPSPSPSPSPSPGRDFAFRQRYLRSYTLGYNNDQEEEDNYNSKHKKIWRKSSMSQRTKNWITLYINNTNIKTHNKKLKTKKKSTSATASPSSSCNSFVRSASSFFFVCVLNKLDVHD